MSDGVKNTAHNSSGSDGDASRAGPRSALVQQLEQKAAEAQRAQELLARQVEELLATREHLTRQVEELRGSRSGLLREREMAEAASASSEGKYRSLFNAIDEGFCIIQMLFGQDGRPNDYLFLEVNAAFEKQSGLAGALGKRILELVPNQDPHWFETYGAVALTGKSRRFATRGEAMGRFFEVYAFRVGAPEERKVAVLFRDETQRKRVEEALRKSEVRQAFLLKLSDALRPLEDPAEIQEVAARVLGEQLRADRVVYFEVGDKYYVVERDYVNAVPHLRGKYPIAAFGPRLLGAYQAGKTVVVYDVETEASLAPEDRAAYAQIHIT